MDLAKSVMTGSMGKHQMERVKPQRECRRTGAFSIRGLDAVIGEQLWQTNLETGDLPSESHDSVASRGFPRESTRSAPGTCSRVPPMPAAAQTDNVQGGRQPPTVSNDVHVSIRRSANRTASQSPGHD